MDFNIGQVINVPFISSDLFDLNLVDECINISKKYWDNSELSYDFKSNWIIFNKYSNNKFN